MVQFPAHIWCLAALMFEARWGGFMGRRLGYLVTWHRVKRFSFVFGRPGSDLLSHVLRHSTISAKAFDHRVRDGIGSCHLAESHQAGEKQKRSKLGLFLFGAKLGTPSLRWSEDLSAFGWPLIMRRSRLKNY